MRLLSHQRNVLAFCYDLYVCSILPWDQLLHVLLCFSRSAATVLVAYYKYGTKFSRLNHSRRTAGEILIQSLGNEYVGAMEQLSPKPCVYLIFSPWFHHRYLGSTTCLRRRAGEHFQKASRPTNHDLQRVHKCMKDLGVENFCIMPIITTEAHAVRRLERLLIKKLQPTMNVAGTVNGWHRCSIMGVWTNPTQRSDNISYLASRMRTAHRHVMLQTLGTAMPPEIGRKCVDRMSSTPGLEGLVRTSAHTGICELWRAKRRPFFRLPQPRFRCKSPILLPIFQITTPYETIRTDNLMRDWTNLLLRCPTTELVCGFCATTCILQLITAGSMQPTDFRDITRAIWSPLVMVSYALEDTCILPMSTALRHLSNEKADNVTCVFTTQSIKANVDGILTLYDIGRKRGNISWTLRRHCFEDVLRLWHTTPMIKSIQWRRTTQGLLVNFMRKKWRFNPTSKAVIRIPCITISGVKRIISGFITKVISKWHLCDTGKGLFSKRVSIVIKGAKTINDRLCNNIAFAKSSSSTPPKCTCAILESVLGLQVTDGDMHVNVRGTSISREPFSGLFKLSAQSSLQPAREDLDQFTVQTVKCIMETMGKWAGEAALKDNYDDFQLGTMMGTGYGFFPEWIGTSFIPDMVYASISAGIQLTCMEWEWILHLRNTICNRWIPAENGLPHIRELEQVRQCLHSVSIISCLDRNRGCLFIQCPVSYWNSLQKQFLGTDGYVRADGKTNRDVIVQTWYKQGVESGIPGTFDMKGEIPYGYINPKDKDVTRFRPIVSFAGAPHRRQLAFCARGLYFIMQEITEPHYTLWNAWDARDEILKAQARLSADNFTTNDGTIRAIVSDVKDMYTALPHKHIVQAVAWVLTVFKKCKRRDRVNVARVGKPAGRTGRLYDNSSRVEIMLQNLFAYVKCMLTSAFFSCGDVLLRQHIGIPMGNHLSPALAIAACMLCENQYIRLQRIGRPIQGLRYMDDILHLTFVHRMDTPELQEEEDKAADMILAQGQQIYPASLRILTTDSTQPLDFLETVLQWKGMLPVFQYADRSHRQRFRDGRSHTPKASLVALVQCMLKRSVQFPSTPSLKIQASLELLLEFSQRNYNLQILRDAVYRLKRSDPVNRPLWTVISTLIQKHHNP